MKAYTRSLETGASLECFLHSPGKPRPALLICPGGGYEYISSRESDPPAVIFFAMGFQVFVLNYRTGSQAADKGALEDLARAVLYVRREAEHLEVEPDHIGVMGFSAGGHLAGCLGVHWDDEQLLARVGAAGEMLRPNALALCYPVITAGEFANRPSMERVSGGDADRAYWSLENQVTSRTPPVFLWHTMDDACVPVENSILMASALHRAGVACECHLYETGPHGLSVCNAEVESPAPDVQSWIELCGRWFVRRFGQLRGLE